MKTNVLGYPRIGEKRELKKANEAFWEGNLTEEELLAVAENIRVHNWTLQKEADIDLIPSNEKSFLNLKLEKTTSLVDESIQEATWSSLAISIPSKNIKSHP